MERATKPMFFETPANLRAWLEKNHGSAVELLVGFRKKGSGRPSVTWPESVDEALFRARPEAWRFFEAQPAWYRKTAIWWVVSAKRDETRRKRLATLIEESTVGRTIRELRRKTPGTGD